MTVPAPREELAPPSANLPTLTTPLSTEAPAVKLLSVPSVIELVPLPMNRNPLFVPLSTPSSCRSALLAWNAALVFALAEIFPVNVNVPLPLLRRTTVGDPPAVAICQSRLELSPLPV